MSTATTALTIEQVECAGINQPAAEREVTLTFTTGQQVKIYGGRASGGDYYRADSYVQHGYQARPTGPDEREAYARTLPAAEYYARWLNGGKYPKMRQF